MSHIVGTQRTFTVPGDGETLVDPPLPSWRHAVTPLKPIAGRRSNDRASKVLEWRERTRAAIVGHPDRPIIVTGHQPELIHPGVWAKYVVAHRFATSVSGEWVDLVADNDAPGTATISVPTVRDGAAGVVQVRWTGAAAGVPFERITPEVGRPLDEFVAELRGLGDTWWDASLMPRIVDNWHRTGTRVSPAMFRAARKAVDAIPNIRGREIRISASWGGPWLFDLVQNAREFALVYNSALARHRAERGILNTRHPMPDLLVTADRVELPVWAIRGSDRRRRLFVTDRGGTMRVFANDEVVADISRDQPPRALKNDGPCDVGEWSLRPRALALTLWARLLLADLFVHGIGGAIYDRITDRIITNYYGLEPPRIACVSATITMELPRTATTPADVARLQALLRDRRWNPQRYGQVAPEAQSLIRGRDLAVNRAEALRRDHPRERKARRDAFHEIRRATALLHQSLEPGESELRTELGRLDAEIAANAAATGREYFIGFHRPERIAELASRLPAVDDFRV